jgi:hypothetical protein
MTRNNHHSLKGYFMTARKSGPEKYGIAALDYEAREKIVDAIAEDTGMAGEITALFQKLPEEIQKKINDTRPGFFAASEDFVKNYLLTEILHTEETPVRRGPLYNRQPDELLVENGETDGDSWRILRYSVYARFTVPDGKPDTQRNR